MIIAIYSIYSFVWWWPLPEFCPILLAKNLMRIMENRWFSKRGHRSVFCQLHSSSTSYFANIYWLLYRIKLSHLSTGQITTENRSLSQKSAWPSNHSDFQCSHLVFQMVPLLCCSIFLCWKYIQTWKKQIIIISKNCWDKSNHNRNIYNIDHLPFEMVYQCYQLLNSTIINE